MHPLLRPLLLLPSILTLACSTPRADSAPPGSWLAVLDKSDATLRVIEPNSGTVKDLAPVANGPHECASSPDGALLVVCGYGDQRPGNALTIWDLVERRVRATIDLSPHQRPHGIAFLSNRTVLVTSETSRAVLEIDLVSEKVVRALDTGADTSHMLALSPDHSRVFTANVRGNSISAIDLTGDAPPKVVPVGNQPEAIAITPDGEELWVGLNGEDALVVLDAATLDVKTKLACGKLPIRVACTPDGKLVVVSCAMSGELALIDRAEKKQLARIALPKRAEPAPGAPPGVDATNPVPVGLVIEPRGRIAYASLAAADQVAVVDLATRSVVRTFATGHGPDGLAWITRREPFRFLGDER
ncbi:MAG: YncE family protein [Planctomycetes bacterium]|nr:YncE family protein [Planctomycetota bacterium]